MMTMVRPQNFPFQNVRNGLVSKRPVFKTSSFKTSQLVNITKRSVFKKYNILFMKKKSMKYAFDLP
jgi:hypothetical protein